MSKSRKGQIENIIESAIAVGEFGYFEADGRYYYTALIDRPNIVVRLYRTTTNDSWLGWSKVNWPDKWDKEFGLRVALGKAASAMIKNGS